MIGWVAEKLLLAGVPMRWTRPLVWLVGLLVLAAMAAVLIDARDDAMIERHDARTDVSVERSGRAADTAATVRAASRAAAQEEARHEFDEATADLPDEGLSARQRIDVCRELREAGTDTALIAECAIVRPGAKAGP